MTSDPNGIIPREPVKQIRVLVDDQVGETVFTPVRSCHLSASRLVDDSHSIANAQEGNTEAEEVSFYLGSAFLIDAGRTTGEDNPFGLEAIDFFQRDVEGMDFAVDVSLADAPCYEPGVLGAKI